MATYSTNFSGYAADAQPSDFTARWVTASNTWAVRSKAGTEGGKSLENTGTVDGRHLLSWDAVDADADRANVEILARVRTSSTTAEQIRLTVRGSGAAGAETGYNLLFDTTSSNFQLHKYVSGASTNLGTAVAYTQVANTWYYLRFRVNGTSLQAKAWADGETEPTAWTLSATDSSISAAGWVGVGNFESTGTRDFDLFVVATNGDTAALATSTTTPVKAHQLAAEAALATVANARIHQLAAEAALATVANARIHQATLEVAIGLSVPGHIHQLVIEVAISQDTGVVQQPKLFIVC